ncbi:ubiquitin carboxyl-terminal hydrolase [Phlyctema vagabunda]|uniref:ubiquitinyl hydrolase 1 n=1 Tax=Phlyctema vagabunda TaxID=108571 RepID=A0ABR4PS73_9HELO
MGVDGRSEQPGKTAPRLITDLLDYDPRKKRKDKLNLLADPAPWFTPHKSNALAPLRRQETDCKHSLVRKDSQTKAPAADGETPGPDTIYNVAAFCTVCRYHFDIVADYQEKGIVGAVCGPGRPNPLHHLLLDESIDADFHKQEYGEDKYNTLTEAHKFVCSAEGCPFELRIKISPPRLGKSLLLPIEDPKKVDARGRRVIAEEPERYAGFRPKIPALVLGVLQTYLSDAVGKAPDEIKKIAVRNKSFRLSFADECDELLKYLDFTMYEEIGDESDESTNVFWKLPDVTDANRQFLDDVLYEIRQKLADRNEKEKELMRALAFAPIPALKDIERSLGYHDFPKRSREITIDPTEEHPFYACLGATANFTDGYIGWAYDQQIRCNPSNKPYYFDCLEDLAKGRSSAELEEKIMIAKSLGELGLKEIEEAYKFLGLDPSQIESDQHVIGLYNSRIASAPRQKQEARDSLRIIGNHRNSSIIQQVANDRTISYDEALELFGVSETTTDDLIEAAAIAMTEDSSDKPLMARAIRVISKRRGGSFILERAAAELEGHGRPSLSLREAYLRLQVKPEMPDWAILLYYDTKYKDASEATKPDYTEAVRAIAQDRQSAFLLAKLDDPNATTPESPASSTEPVGLDNIGNTCYLNSLLQYYYTVKAVRDVVIGFQEHCMPLETEDIVKKRVGGRAVVKSEIIKAQKFVKELHDLFENLKTASTRSVKPTRELAELTIFSSAAEANFRRASISSPTVPSLVTSINGTAVGPSVAQIEQTGGLDGIPADIEMAESPAEKIIDATDNSSETTLVDMKDTQDSETVEGAPQESGVDAVMSEPQILNNDKIEFGSQSSKPQLGKDSDGDELMNNGEPLTPPDSPQMMVGTLAFDKPPPIPPRNKSSLVIETSETKLNDELWRFGTQQDVTEVIGNVLFRLQCAIKPTSIDSDGGQRDSIKDTFYGSNAVYLRKRDKVEKKIEEWNSLIVPPAPSGPRDIYDALDVVFDEQFVEVDNALVPQFTSIHKLPPILQIWINRTDFDQATQRAWKNTNPITFPEVVYLDRYIDSEDSEADQSLLMARRKEAWKWKAHLRRLGARQQALEKEVASLNVPEALVATQEFISELQEDSDVDIPIDSEFSTALVARVAHINAEIAQLTSAISHFRQKLQEQFSDLHTHRYQLHTVFIHRGDASGGHYFIYIYDFEGKVWREYNDERVSTITDTERIFDPEKGAGGTPYFLSYVRDPDLVDAVHRQVPEIVQMLPGGDMNTPDLIHSKGSPQALAPGNRDDSAEDAHIEHVERVKPQQRELRPKPTEWENSAEHATDIYGEPW